MYAAIECLIAASFVSGAGSSNSKRSVPHLTLTGMSCDGEMNDETANFLLSFSPSSWQTTNVYSPPNSPFQLQFLPLFRQRWLPLLIALSLVLHRLPILFFSTLPLSLRLHHAQNQQQAWLPAGLVQIFPFATSIQVLSMVL